MGGTALAIISTTMGGGIVSIPYAFAAAGFMRGLMIQMCIVCFALISTQLYVSTRNLLGSEYSFSDIAHKSIGRKPGMMLNVLIALALFGVLTLYFILFSRIAISIFGSSHLCENEDTLDDVGCTSILNQKWFYIAILIAIQTPIVVKESLEEIKFTTYVLFAGVISLVLLLLTMVIRKEEVETGMVISEKEVTLESTMDSINISVASYGFVICLFPIMKDMKDHG
jgi:amino acid permease